MSDDLVEQLLYATTVDERSTALHQVIDEADDYEVLDWHRAGLFDTILCCLVVTASNAKKNNGNGQSPKTHPLADHDDSAFTVTPPAAAMDALMPHDDSPGSGQASPRRQSKGSVGSGSTNNINEDAITTEFVELCGDLIKTLDQKLPANAPKGLLIELVSQLTEAILNDETGQVFAQYKMRGGGGPVGAGGGEIPDSSIRSTSSQAAGASSSPIPPLVKAAHPWLLLFLASFADNATQQIQGEVLRFLLAYIGKHSSAQLPIGLSRAPLTLHQSPTANLLGLSLLSAGDQPSRSGLEARASSHMLNPSSSFTLRPFSFVPMLDLPSKRDGRGEHGGIKRPSIDPNRHFVDETSLTIASKTTSTPRQQRKALPALKAMIACGHKVGQLYATIDAKILLGMKKEFEALNSAAQEEAREQSVDEFAACGTEIIVTPPVAVEEQPFSFAAPVHDSMFRLALNAFEEEDRVSDPLRQAARIALVMINCLLHQGAAGAHETLSGELFATIGRHDTDLATTFINALRKSAMYEESRLFRLFRQPVTLVGYPIEVQMSTGSVPEDALLKHWAAIAQHLLDRAPTPWDELTWHLAILAHYMVNLDHSKRSTTLQAANLCLPLVCEIADLLRRDVAFKTSFATAIQYIVEIFDSLLTIPNPPQLLQRVLASLLLRTQQNPLESCIREYTRRMLLSEDAHALFGLRRPQDSKIFEVKVTKETLFWPNAFDMTLHMVRMTRHFKLLTAYIKKRYASLQQLERISFDSETHPIAFMINPFDGCALNILAQPSNSLNYPLQHEILHLIVAITETPHVSPLIQNQSWASTYIRFLYLQFLQTYNSEAFVDQDPIALSCTALTLQALTAICAHDENARIKAHQLGIVSTLVQEVDLEQSVGEMRERHIRRSTVATIFSDHRPSDAGSMSIAAEGSSSRRMFSVVAEGTPRSGPMFTPTEDVLRRPSDMTSGGRSSAATPLPPALQIPGGKESSVGSNVQSSLTSPTEQAPEAQVPLPPATTTVTAVVTSDGSGTNTAAPTPKAGAAPTATPTPMASSAPTPVPAVKKPMVFTIPKLSLGNAPPPLYYTSNGDTGGAVEAGLNTPSTPLDMSGSASITSMKPLAMPPPALGAAAGKKQPPVVPPVPLPEKKPAPSITVPPHASHSSDDYSKGLDRSVTSPLRIGDKKKPFPGKKSPMLESPNSSLSDDDTPPIKFGDDSVDDEESSSDSREPRQRGQRENSSSEDENEHSGTGLSKRRLGSGGVPPLGPSPYDRSLSGRGGSVVSGGASPTKGTGRLETATPRSALKTPKNNRTPKSPKFVFHPSDASKTAAFDVEPLNLDQSSGNLNTSGVLSRPGAESSMDAPEARASSRMSFAGRRQDSLAVPFHAMGGSISSASDVQTSKRPSDTASMLNGTLKSLDGSLAVDRGLYPLQLLQDASRFTAHQRSMRRVYVDLDVQAEILFLILLLTVRPEGMLDERLIDSYTVCSKKINILFYLQMHVNHHSNHLAVEKLKDRVRSGTANRGLHVLLRLLISNEGIKEMYSAKERIGNGAYGVVRATRLALSHSTEAYPFACKYIPLPRHIDDRAAIISLHSEVMAMLALQDHSGVCRMVDFGNDGVQYCLVMHRYRLSMSKWRSQFGIGLNPKHLGMYFGLFLQVVDLVHATHFRGIVHYDIKCDNFLLDVDELGEVLVPHIGDFGEAELLIKEEDVSQSTYRSSSRFGNPDKRSRGTEVIRSPECLLPHKFKDRRRKMHQAGFQSDVWSLGCLLFELLTGRHLFHEEHYMKLIRRVTSEDGEILELDHRAMLGSDPNVRNEISNFLLFVLCRDPQRRPVLSELRNAFIDLTQKLDVKVKLPSSKTLQSQYRSTNGGDTNTQQQLHSLGSTKGSMLIPTMATPSHLSSTNNTTQQNSKTTKSLSPLASPISVVAVGGSGFTSQQQSHSHRSSLQPHAINANTMNTNYTNPRGGNSPKQGCAALFTQQQVIEAVRAWEERATLEALCKLDDDSLPLTGSGHTNIAAPFGGGGGGGVSGGSSYTRAMRISKHIVVCRSTVPTIEFMYRAGVTHVLTLAELPSVENHFHYSCIEEQLVNIRTQTFGEQDFSKVCLGRVCDFINAAVACNGVVLLPAFIVNDVDMGFVILLLYFVRTYGVKLVAAFTSLANTYIVDPAEVSLKSCFVCAALLLELCDDDAYAALSVWVRDTIQPVVEELHPLGGRVDGGATVNSPGGSGGFGLKSPIDGNLIGSVPTSVAERQHSNHSGDLVHDDEDKDTGTELVSRGSSTPSVAPLEQHESPSVPNFTPTTHQLPKSPSEGNPLHGAGNIVDDEEDDDDECESTKTRYRCLCGQCVYSNSATDSIDTDVIGGGGGGGIGETTDLSATAKTMRPSPSSSSSSPHNRSSEDRQTLLEFNRKTAHVSPPYVLNNAVVKKMISTMTMLYGSAIVEAVYPNDTLYVSTLSELPFNWRPVDIRDVELSAAAAAMATAGAMLEESGNLQNTSLTHNNEDASFSGHSLPAGYSSCGPRQQVRIGDLNMNSNMSPLASPALSPRYSARVPGHLSLGGGGGGGVLPGGNNSSSTSQMQQRRRLSLGGDVPFMESKSGSHSELLKLRAERSMFVRENGVGWRCRSCRYITHFESVVNSNTFHVNCSLPENKAAKWFSVNNSGGTLNTNFGAGGPSFGAGGILFATSNNLLTVPNVEHTFNGGEGSHTFPRSNRASPTNRSSGGGGGGHHHFYPLPTGSSLGGSGGGANSASGGGGAPSKREQQDAAIAALLRVPSRELRKFGDMRVAAWAKTQQFQPPPML